MNVFDALKSRLTVRRFKPDPVPEDVVTRLLQVGLWSPRSQNLQPWHFVVIRDRHTLRSIGQISTYGPFISDAPIAIAIGMDKSTADRPELDAGRALQQMEVLAWSEGMGTCFVAVHEPEQNRRIAELLGIPSGIELITVMPFGYRPDGIRGTNRRRRRLEEVAHSERFGQPYRAGDPATGGEVA
jgi:nitroreductase